jgi:hypothetical protein
VKTHGYDQWKVILGESVMEERIKFEEKEVSKMWQDVFEDSKKKADEEEKEEYGPEIDEEEEKRKKEEEAKQKERERELEE